MRTKKAITIAQRLLAFVMAIYLFNYSIDSRDAHPDHIGEDLSFNDIESIFEFSLECLLGFENAIEEHDERDQDQAGAFDFHKVFYKPSISKVEVASGIFIQFTYSANNYIYRLANASREINSPPPKA